MTFKGNWDSIFANTEWSLCIQNRNPCPSQGSRNIFEDDKKEILAAAKKHGFKQISPNSAAVISFIKAFPQSHPSANGDLK